MIQKVFSQSFVSSWYL